MCDGSAMDIYRMESIGVLRMNRLKRYMRMSFYAKYNNAKIHYYRFKGRVFYCHIFKNIGNNSIVMRPIMLSNCEHVWIGNNVSIRDGARIEIVCDNALRVPELRIGDNVMIEQNVQIVCHSRVIIGSDVAIAGHCAIVDVTHPYRHISTGNVGALIVDEDSYVEIGDGSFIGYGAVILPNVRIGKRAVIGANSVVTHDVPDFSVVAGSPAKIIRTYSQE